MIRLLVLGDLNLDVHAEEPTETAAGLEVRAAARVSPGGSAGTFARVAAGFGARVIFLGSIGADSVGDLLEADLKQAGVEPRLVRAPGPSGVVVSIHRKGDRSMICSRGANDALEESHVDASLFEGLDHLHVSGYAFLSPTQSRAAHSAMCFARDAGISVSANVPPANLVRAHGVDRLRQSLAGVSHLFLNREEGRCLTDAEADTEIVDVLARTFGAGALTLGAEGALAWRGNRRDYASGGKALDIDPTGAGDAYAAAFVVSVLQGGSLADANARACSTARTYIASRAMAS